MKLHRQILAAFCALVLTLAPALAQQAPLNGGGGGSISSGLAAGRPSPCSGVYFDKTLNAPLLCSGSAWVDGLGRPVAVPAITLPITANLLGFYSVVRLSTWTGNCMLVGRGLDTATLAIGWVNNVCDKASAYAFAQGTGLLVKTWYDQSGATKDMTAATNAPIMNALNEWMGIAPVSMDGTPTITAQAMTSALAGNANALTVYQVAAPRTSFEDSVSWEATNAGFTTAIASVYHALGPLSSNYPGSFLFGMYERSQMGVSSASMSGTAGLILRANGVQLLNATVATSTAFAGLQIGKSAGGSAFVGMMDLFSMAVYGAAHTSVQMGTVEAAMTAPYTPQTTFTNRLLYAGSSLVSGWQSLQNQQMPWQEGFGRGLDASLPTWEIINLGQGGRTLAAEAALYSGTYAPLYDATKTKNVLVTDAPSNDDAGSSFANSGAATTAATTLYNGTFLTYVAAAKATGFKVVVPTMIARTGFDTTTNWFETYRLAWNALVLAGATANGYTASDRASVASGAFNSTAATANTVYYASDGIHGSTLGYGLLGASDLAAIQAAH